MCLFLDFGYVQVIKAVLQSQTQSFKHWSSDLDSKILLQVLK